MNLVFVGCEYAGKSTLATEVMKWAEDTVGGTSHFHDHFSVPSSELTPEAQESLLALHPQALEMLQRYMIEYHISEAFYSKPDHNLMGLVIEEAVYAPLYYGYGGKETGSPFRSPEGQRTGDGTGYRGEDASASAGVRYSSFSKPPRRSLQNE